MAIVRWNDPLGGMHMRSPLDDLLGGFWGAGLPSHSSAGLPAMDVYTEDDTSMVAEVQAPGFGKDDIEVNVHDGVLEIKGEKHDKEEDGTGKRTYMMRESHESFYRSIQLPKVADAGHIEAHFEDGVLKVRVPFREAPAPQRVSISGGKSSKPDKDVKKK